MLCEGNYITENNMKYIKLFWVLFYSFYIASAFCGDKNALSNKNNWTQCNEIPNWRVTGIGVSENNLIAATFIPLVYKHYSDFFLVSTYWGKHRK